MPRPTADAVRRVAAERYGKTDLTDAQVNAILADPDALKAAGLETTLYERVEDFTKPFLEPPQFVRDAAAGAGDWLNTFIGGRVENQIRNVTPGAQTTGPLGSPERPPIDMAAPDGAAMDLATLPGKVVQTGAELLNPLDIAAAATSFGGSLPVSIAAKARPVARGLSGLMAARGVSNVAEGVSEGDIPTAVQGAVETLAGGLGVRATRPPVRPATVTPPPAAVSSRVDDLKGLLSDPAALEKVSSPDDVVKLLTSSKQQVSARSMIDELMAVNDDAELDAVLAKYAPPPAPAAPSGVSTGDLRAQRLLTEQARTRAAAARATITEQRAARYAPNGPLAKTPALAPANAAQKLVDPAFPLSGRLADAPAEAWAPFGRGASSAPVERGMTDVPIGVRGSSGRFLAVEPVERTASGTLKTLKVGDYTIDLTNMPGGRLTASEIKDLMIGRGKLLAQVKGKQLPDVVVSELDRMSVEYRRTVQELSRLEADVMADPMKLAQMNQAKRELGFRLAQQTRSALTEALRDEKGFINPAMTMLLGRASASVAAGATGYALTEEPEDRMTNAILAAGGTALAFSAIPKVTQALLTASGRGHVTQKTVSDYLYFSMLSRPATILRSSMGALSGGAHGVLEKLLQGDVANARKILTALMSDGPTDWLTAVRHGVPQLRTATGGRTASGLTGLPLRLISAGDHAVVNALKKGGFTIDEAQRLTAAGPPASKFGRDFVQMIGKNWLASLISPFPRVQTLLAEYPLSPIMGKQWGLTTGQRAARGAITVGAGVTGYQVGKDLDPRLRPFLVAAAGPSAIPMALGVALGWANEQKGDPTASGVDQASDLLNVAGNVLGEENPFAMDPVSTFRDITTGQRFIPGVVSDIARVMDDGAPGGRDRREQGRTAAARSRIPGVAGGFGREALPPRTIPKDIFGDDLPFQRSPENPLAKLFMGDPVASDLPSRYPADSPVAQELRRLGLNLTPPRGGMTYNGNALPLDESQIDTIAQMKGEIMERALSQIVNSEGFARLSDVDKQARLDDVIDLVQTMFGRDDARAMLLSQAVGAR